MAKKKELDNIERDVIAAMRLGYGVHYGRYKADYPHTKDRPVPEPKKEPETEQDAVCSVCGKKYLRSDGCGKFCSEECRKVSRRARERKYYKNKRGEIAPIACPVCGKDFLPVSRRQKYCASVCARKAGWMKQARKRKEEKREKQALAE
jgi:predicted nucleic acid-binding Zn ribbon protein